jgi:hypothetical protein
MSAEESHRQRRREAVWGPPEALELTSHLHLLHMPDRV